MMELRYGISDDGDLRLDDTYTAETTSECVDFQGDTLFVLGKQLPVTYRHAAGTAGVEVKLSLVNCRDLRNALTTYLDSQAGLS